MTGQRDYGALRWVIGEIEQTVEQASHELLGFADHHSDPTRLRMALTHIHQLHATLRVVDCPSATALAAEVEAGAQALLNEEVEANEEALQALLTATMQLPGYLKKVANAGQEFPGALLSLHDDLRALRGLPPLPRESGTDWDLSLLELGSGEAAELAGESELAELRQHRQRYQQGLLELLRGGDTAACLGILQAISAALSLRMAGAGQQAFWLTSQAYIEALQRQLIGLGIDEKTLLRSLDTELKDLLQAGSALNRRPGNEDLYRKMLMAVHQVSGDTDAITLVQNRHGLASGSSGAMDDFGGTEAVVKEVSQQLEAMQGDLEQLARGDTAALARLGEVGDAVAGLASTLSMLGFNDEQAMLLEQQQNLRSLGQGGEADTAVLTDVLAAFMSVNEGMASRLAALGIVTQSESDNLQRARASVFTEVQNGLEQIKQQVRDFVDNGQDTTTLENAPELLHGLIGAMQMLELSRLQGYLEQTADYISALHSGQRQASGDDLDRLADAVSGIEYFLEQHGETPEQASSILDRVAERLSELSIAPAEMSTEADAESAFDSAPVEEPEIELAPKPEIDLAPVAETDLTLEPDVDLAAEPEIDLEPETGAEELLAAVGEVELDADVYATISAEEPVAEAEAESATDMDEAAATLDLAPEHEVAEAASDVAATEVDEEILEIFVEEAEEVQETINTWFPSWQEDSSNQEALTELRRAFHTLKGSGRMVGAEAVGELAWSIENLLNKVVEETVVVTPPVFEAMDRARELMPGLVAEFAGQGKADRQSVQAVQDGAGALARNEPFDFGVASEAGIEAKAEPVVESAAVEDAVIELTPEPDLDLAPEPAVEITTEFDSDLTLEPDLDLEANPEEELATRAADELSDPDRLGTSENARPLAPTSEPVPDYGFDRSMALSVEDGTGPVATNKDYSALRWVSGEIEKTVEQATTALLGFADNRSDPEPLRTTLNHAHQLHATLRVVDCPTATLLAAEVETVTEALLKEEIEVSEQALQALLTATMQLPGYLKKVSNAGQEFPSALLPLHDDLRALRGLPPLPREGNEGDPENLGQGAGPAVMDDLGGTANVVKEVSQQLEAIQDDLEQLARGDTAALARLGEAGDTVDVLASTLSVLGFTDEQSLLSEQRRSLKALGQGGAADTVALTDVLAAFMKVNQGMASRLAALGIVTQSESDDQISARSAIFTEVQNGLEQIKQQVSDFVDNGQDTTTLENAPELLHGLIGAMQMLELSRLQGYLEQTADYISALHSGQRQASGDDLDRLADAVSGIEYFLEQHGETPEQASSILDRVAERLSELSIAPAEMSTEADAESAFDSAPVEEPEIELAPKPEIDLAPVAETDLTLEPDVDLAAEPEIDLEPETGAEELLAAVGEVELDADVYATISAEEPVAEAEAESATDMDEAAATLDLAPEHEVAEAASDVVATEVDEEILEIFVEEAEEVQETINTWFPSWQEDSSNQEALTELRRAFHTLKGSGRMVGAEAVGELAWSIENLLNKVVEETVVVTPPVFEAMDRARELMPGLVAEFAGQGKADRQSVQAVQDGAGALARNEPFDFGVASEAGIEAKAEPVVESAAVEDAVIELTPEPDLDLAPEPDLDPNLEPASQHGPELDEDLSESALDFKLEQDLELTPKPAVDSIVEADLELTQESDINLTPAPDIGLAEAFDAELAPDSASDLAMEPDLGLSAEHEIDLAPEPTENAVEQAEAPALNFVDEPQLEAQFPQEGLEPAADESDSAGDGETIELEPRPEETDTSPVTDSLLELDAAESESPEDGPSPEEGPSLEEGPSPEEEPSIQLESGIAETDPKGEVLAEEENPLLSIFREETGELIATMGACLEQLRGADSAEPADDLLRVLHTLRGSAKMVDADAIATVMGPLEDLAQKAMHRRRPLADDALDLLESARDLVLRWLDSESEPTLRADADTISASAVTFINQMQEASLQDTHSLGKGSELIAFFELAERHLGELGRVLEAADPEPAASQDWLGLTAPLTELADAARKVDVLPVAEVADALSELAPLLAANAIKIDDEARDYLQIPNGLLLDMMDCLAADQSIPNASAALEAVLVCRDHVESLPSEPSLTPEPEEHALSPADEDETQTVADEERLLRAEPRSQCRTE